MKKKYIVPISQSVRAEYEDLIATSSAGSDTAKGDNYKYDEEVDISSYFEGGSWQ